MDEKTKDLWSAYAGVLNEVPNFITDENVNAGKRVYKYLNLATILKAIKPLFKKHGLSFFQKVKYNEGQTGNVLCGTVVTVIYNSETLAEICEYPFVISADPQSIGSSITYARRYSLYAVLGIYPDKDDDGQYAQNTYLNQNHNTIDNNRAAYLISLARNNGVNLEALAKQVAKRNIQRPTQLTVDEANEIENAIRGGRN